MGNTFNKEQAQNTESDPLPSFYIKLCKGDAEYAKYHRLHKINLGKKA